MGQLKVTKHITVKASPEACWEFWANADNFVKTFDAVTAVKRESDTRSVWSLNLPSGKEAEIPMRREGTAPGTLAWITDGGSIIFNSGFRFTPTADGGTDLGLDSEIQMEGLPGLMLPAMKPVIEQRMDQVLQRFKSVIEAT